MAAWLSITQQSARKGVADDKPTVAASHGDRPAAPHRVHEHGRPAWPPGRARPARTSSALPHLGDAGMPQVRSFGADVFG